MPAARLFARAALLLVAITGLAASASATTSPGAERAALASERSALLSGTALPAEHPDGLSTADKIARIDQTLAARPAPQSGRWIEVNVAEGVVRGWDGESETFESHAIVGKTTTRTPLFSAPAVSVTFNPTWHIPASLRDEEGADAVPPGPRNPLGHVRVNMPNDNSVYLHSTNQRKLFDRKDRHTFSHGCVRVQDAVGLGRWLLGDARWDSVGGDSLTSGWTERTVALPHPVPVIIAYWTAGVDDSGRVVYYRDPYGMAR